VLLWTGGLYALSAAIGHALVDFLGLPLPLAVALPIVALALSVPLVRRIRKPRQPAVP
jgi:hypothetical protein